MSNKENKVLKEEKKNSIPKNMSDLAKDLLKIIATSNLRLGDRDKDSAKEESIKYKEATLQMLDLLFKHNIELLELEIIFQLMRQALAIFEGTLAGSIELSSNQALKSFWGKHPDELRMSDIENKLKEIGEKNKDK